MIFFKIIIPNYNSEKYIQKTLDSIFNQTFKDYVIVIVDDMSTDNSVDIIENIMKEKTDKIKIALLESQKKVWNSGAKNIGIDFNDDETKYTLFIDCDDTFVDENCFEEIYKAIIKNNYPDCVRLSYNWCGDETRYVSLNEKTPEELINNCNVAQWTKCIKTPLVKLFPEATLMDDTVQHIEQCDIIETVISIDKPIINWNRKNPDSVSTNDTINNHKYSNSIYRFCADLSDLYYNLNKEYTKDYCKRRLMQLLKDTKGRINIDLEKLGRK